MGNGADDAYIAVGISGAASGRTAYRIADWPLVGSFVRKGIVTVTLPGLKTQLASAGSGPGPVGAPHQLLIAWIVVPVLFWMPQLRR